MNSQPVSAALTVRLTFSKKGYAKYISHLDLQRAMMRLLRRAEIPLWMTQGFNPHPYLNFCSPLSVGIEGENELLDIKLSDALPDFQAMRDNIANNLPVGFQLKSISIPSRDFGDVEYVCYKIVTSVSADIINDFISQPEINVIKKTKKSEINLDLKSVATIDSVESRAVTSDVFITLPCGRELNVNPMLWTKALEEFAGMPDSTESVIRLKFLDAAKKVF